MPHPLAGRPLGAIAAFLGGALGGALTPCATAAVGAAAALSPGSPPAAAGILATAGVIQILRPDDSRAQAETQAQHSMALAPVFVALAFAALWLTVQQARGFLNPRIALLAPAGAVVAVVAALRSRGMRTHVGTMVLPAALALALAFGSPEPAQRAATSPLGLYPGARVEFLGQLHASGLEIARATILCCRADAQVLGFRLAARASLPDGSWAVATGVVQRRSDGLVLDAQTVRRVPPPKDPFAYF
jgi:hypothetical protein